MWVLGVVLWGVVTGVPLLQAPQLNYPSEIISSYIDADINSPQSVNRLLHNPLLLQSLRWLTHNTSSVGNATGKCTCSLGAPLRSTVDLWGLEVKIFCELLVQCGQQQTSISGSSTFQLTTQDLRLTKIDIMSVLVNAKPLESARDGLNAFLEPAPGVIAEQTDYSRLFEETKARLLSKISDTTQNLLQNEEGGGGQGESLESLAKLPSADSIGADKGPIQMVGTIVLNSKKASSSEPCENMFSGDDEENKSSGSPSTIPAGFGGISASSMQSSQNSGDKDGTKAAGGDSSTSSSSVSSSSQVEFSSGSLEFLSGLDPGSLDSSASLSSGAKPGCLAASEHVVAAGVLKQLRDVRVGDRILSGDGREVFESEVIFHTCTQTKIPLIRLGLDSGASLSLTETHLVATDHEFVRAKDLRVGQLVHGIANGMTGLHSVTSIGFTQGEICDVKTASHQLFVNGVLVSAAATNHKISQILWAPVRLIHQLSPGVTESVRFQVAVFAVATFVEKLFHSLDLYPATALLFVSKYFKSSE